MQRLVYLLVYPLLIAIAYLPRPLFYGLSNGLAFLLHSVIRYRRRLVRENLQLVFPEKPLESIITIEKQTYRHFTDTFLEMLLTLRFTESEMREHMRFTNLEVLQPYLDANQSFFIMCGHYNSYEWLLSMALYVKCEGYAVYTPLSNKYFDKLVKRTRSRFNCGLVSRYEVGNLIHKKKNERISIGLGFASDQSPQNKPKQYRRKFLGIEVPVFTGAERIAKEYNAPVFYAEINKIKRGYYQTTLHLIAADPVSVPNYEITDQFTALLEAQIRENPVNYLWTHNRFKHRTL